MTTQSELLASLNEVLSKQNKTFGEIQLVQESVTALKAQVADLQSQITQGGLVTPELEALVASIRAKADEVDNLIPDVEVTPPAPQEPSPEAPAEPA